MKPNMRKAINKEYEYKRLGKTKKYVNRINPESMNIFDEGWQEIPLTASDKKKAAKGIRDLEEITWDEARPTKQKVSPEQFKELLDIVNEINGMLIEHLDWSMEPITIGERIRELRDKLNGTPN